MDKIISIKIPSEKVTEALEGWLTLYPNTEVNDPGNPESGLKYTDSQWIGESLRRIVVRDIKRGLQVKANAEAQVLLDNDMATVVE